MSDCDFISLEALLWLKCWKDPKYSSFYNGDQIRNVSHCHPQLFLRTKNILCSFHNLSSWNFKDVLSLGRKAKSFKQSTLLSSQIVLYFMCFLLSTFCCCSNNFPLNSAHPSKQFLYFCENIWAGGGGGWVWNIFLFVIKPGTRD